MQFSDGLLWYRFVEDSVSALNEMFVYFLIKTPEVPLYRYTLCMNILYYVCSMYYMLCQFLCVAILES